jgi:hypothetical protein
MKLQKCKYESNESHDIAVVAAMDIDRDKKEQRYLLIVPKRDPSIGSDKIADYFINQGAVLQITEVPVLTDLLKSLVKNWDLERPSKEALLWEFSTNPRFSELDLADSVALSFPSLSVYASSFEDGIGIIMVLSESGRKRSIEIKNKEGLECLVNALERGVTTANELKL